MAYTLNSLLKDFEQTEGITLANYPSIPADNDRLRIHPYDQETAIGQFDPPIAVADKLTRHLSIPSILSDLRYGFPSGHYERQVLEILSREGYTVRELLEPVLPVAQLDYGRSLPYESIHIHDNGNDTPVTEEAARFFTRIFTEIAEIGDFHTADVDVERFLSSNLDAQVDGQYPTKGLLLQIHPDMLILGVMTDEARSTMTCKSRGKIQPLESLQSAGQSLAIRIAANLVDIFDRGDVYEMRNQRTISETAPVYRSSMTRIADSFMRAVTETRMASIVINRNNIGFQSHNPNASRSVYCIGVHQETTHEET